MAKRAVIGPIAYQRANVKGQFRVKSRINPKSLEAINKYLSEIIIDFSTNVPTDIVVEAIETIYKKNVIALCPSPVEERKYRFGAYAKFDPTRFNYDTPVGRGMPLLNAIKQEHARVTRQSGKSGVFQVGFGDVARMNRKTIFSWLFRKRGSKTPVYITQWLSPENNNTVQMFEWGGLWEIEPRSWLGSHRLHPWQGQPVVRKNGQDVSGLSMIPKMIKPRYMFTNGLNISRNAIMQYITDGLKQYIKNVGTGRKWGIKVTSGAQGFEEW